MAFYQNVPGRRPVKKDHQQDKWEEDGSRYRGASARRFGPDAEDDGDRRSTYRGGRDTRSGYQGQGRAPYQGDGRRNDRRPGGRQQHADRQQPCAQQAAQAFNPQTHVCSLPFREKIPAKAGKRNGSRCYSSPCREHPR